LYATGYVGSTPATGSVTLQTTGAYSVYSTNGFQGGVGGIRGSVSGNVGTVQPSNTATLSGTWRVLSPVAARWSAYEAAYNYTDIQYTGLLVQRIS
jgi:hypothetical protein